MTDSKEDKTVFQPSKKRSEQSTDADDSAHLSHSVDEHDVDKTVFKPSKKESESSENSTSASLTREQNTDKTVFQPKSSESRDLEDKTRVIGKRQPDDTDAQFHALANSETFVSLSPEEQKRVALLAAKRRRERPDKTTEAALGNEDKTRFLPTKSSSIEETLITSPPVGNTPDSPNPPSSAQPVTEINSAELLKGRFHLECVLGAGGMGVVYKAKDLLKVEAQDRDPYVAIKVLGEEFRSHPEAFIALQRESRKTQRIAHPNIVNVHDFDRDGDTVFMTMEFMEGEPLDKIISKYRGIGLPEDLAWTILEGISAALIHAHKERIIHSDFKPGNIFVTKKGAAKVFDFGIARAVAKAEHLEESEDDKTVFDAGDLGALTPAYASYEMLEGEIPDIRDDIYALGCIAYELFTGAHPYNRVHANEAKKKGLQVKRIPNISKSQWKVIQSAIAFERADRVATVDEFWSRLTQKRKSNVVAGLFLMILLSGFVGAGYLVYLEKTAVPAGSEEELRSEIELKLRIEEAKRNLEQWVASPDFSDRSLERVEGYVISLRKRLADSDEWLVGAELKVFAVLFKTIDTHINNKSFDSAKSLLKESEKYTQDLTLLQAKAREIEDALGEYLTQKAVEEKKLEDERKAAARKKTQRAAKAVQAEQINLEFDVAMSTVDKQLTCRRTINMRDLGIAVTKLRELDPKRYAKQDSRIINSVVSCLQGIGKTFPERAEEYKTLAKRIFPTSPEIINLRIVARDPCNSSIAGLGSRGGRALCRDKLKNVGRGPGMVVIPSKGSLPQFAIGKYEVSNTDFKLYCNAADDCQKSVSTAGNLPVTNLTLDEVEAYIRWLSDISGKTYRLPTLSEWKYAARANTDKLDPNRNCKLNSRGIQKGGSVVPVDVGTQNKWGLVGHIGNVQELVSNSDGSVSAVGGSFKTDMDECTVEMQVPFSGRGDGQTGFRLIRLSQSN